MVRKNIESLSDEELLSRLMRGDEESFTLLYHRRQPGIYRFALEMSGSCTVAEEVAQEVFMTLIRLPERYDATRGSLGAYLYGIARNLVLKQNGREAWYITPPQEWREPEGPVPATLIEPENPLNDLTARESIELIREAVLALPPDYRAVVVLCDLDEKSYTEAAEILGCKIGTVRSRLHRARALLLRKLRGNREPKQARCSA